MLPVLKYCFKCFIDGLRGLPVICFGNFSNVNSDCDCSTTVTFVFHGCDCVPRPSLCIPISHCFLNFDYLHTIGVSKNVLSFGYNIVLSLCHRFMWFWGPLGHFIWERQLYDCITGSLCGYIQAYVFTTSSKANKILMVKQLNFIVNTKFGYLST